MKHIPSNLDLERQSLTVLKQVYTARLIEVEERIDEIDKVIDNGN